MSRFQITTVLEHLIWFSLAFCWTIGLIVWLVLFFLSYIPISAISSKNSIVYKVKLDYLMSRLQLTTVLEHLVWFNLAFVRRFVWVFFSSHPYRYLRYLTPFKSDLYPIKNKVGLSKYLPNYLPQASEIKLRIT